MGDESAGGRGWKTCFVLLVVCLFKQTACKTGRHCHAGKLNIYLVIHEGQLFWSRACQVTNWICVHSGHCVVSDLC